MKFVFQIRSVAFCVFCFYILVQYSASAQAEKFEEGYIITTKGDSLYGFVLNEDHAFNPKTCSFKAGSPRGELKTYSSDDIKAFGVGTKKKYVAYTIKSGENNEKVFISCIVKGKASLFYFQERYFVDSGNGLKELLNTTTSVDPDGKVYSQPLPVYKGVLQTAMNDCSTIHENLKGASLKKYDLIKLFEGYHECIGKSATVYETGAGKIKIALGIALSGQSTSFDLTSEGHPSYLYLDNNEAMTDFSLTPALIVEFYAPEGAGRFRVRSGLSYYTGNYHVYDPGSNGALDHQLTIEMARIELPVMLKYYPLKNAGLYVAGGMGFNVSVKWNQKSVTIQPPMTIISESSGLENNSFYTNPMAGVGYDFPIGKRKIFIEGIFGYSRYVLSSSIDPVGKLKSLTFTTGFVF